MKRLEYLIWDEVFGILNDNLRYPLTLTHIKNKKFVKTEVTELLDRVVARTVWESISNNSLNVVESRI